MNPVWRSSASSLSLKPRDLLVRLADALAQLRGLPSPRRAPRREQPLLAVEDRAHRRIASGPDRQLFAPGDGVRVPELRLQPVAPGRELGRLRLQHRRRRAHIGIAEPDQNLARRHPGAVAHQDLAHRAAVEMLHRLLADLDLDPPGGDHRAGDVRERAPSEHPAAQNGQGHDAQRHRAPRREGARVPGSGRGHAVSPPSAGFGPGAGFTSRTALRKAGGPDTTRTGTARA